MQAKKQQAPPELPPPLPPNLSLQARKQKGSTRKQALTGAEASERQQKALTRAQTRARAVQVAQDSQEKKVVTSSRRKTRSQKAAELIEDQLQRDAAEHM